MTARVVYSLSASLDGYINSANGSLDWADVDEEIHSYFNDRARDATAFVYGRRMYETMAAYWPFALDDAAAGPVIRDFAQIWQPKPKIVFSSTLGSVNWNSRLERADIVAALPALKAEFDGELDIGGATLAAPLVARNLIDEYRVMVHPVLIGGGTPFFPALTTQLELRLADTRQFSNGATLLTYSPR